MDKLLWVLLPIAAAAAAVGVLAWRGRLPSRPVLNVAFSLLLLVYLLITAGLGLFWVANQHLPVFDWHYVFGYALLLLVVVHLGFNLRQVLFHLRRKPMTAAPPGRAGRRPVLGAFGLLSLGAAAGIGYLIGLRHGRTELRVSADSGAPAAAAAAVVEAFHGFSAHSRSGVLRRASSTDWGDPPPPFKTSSAGPALPLPEARRAASPRPSTALDAAALADLLWHAAGVSARSGGIHFRTSPSSGALFATELYVLALRVDGVPAGLWHFDVPGHALAPVTAGALEGDALGTGALPADALALLVATAVFRRSGHKYRDRTYRYVLGDLGHALENLRVVATRPGWPAPWASTNRRKGCWLRCCCSPGRPLRCLRCGPRRGRLRSADPAGPHGRHPPRHLLAQRLGAAARREPSDSTKRAARERAAGALAARTEPHH